MSKTQKELLADRIENTVDEFITGKTAAPSFLEPLVAKYRKLIVFAELPVEYSLTDKSQKQLEDDMFALFSTMKTMVEMVVVPMIAEIVAPIVAPTIAESIAEPIVLSRREIARKLWIDEQYAIARVTTPKALTFAPAPVAPPTAPTTPVAPVAPVAPAIAPTPAAPAPIVRSAIHLVPENHPMPGKPVGAPTPARPQGVHANKPMPGTPLAEAFGDKLMDALSRKRG